MIEQTEQTRCNYCSVHRNNSGFGWEQSGDGLICRYCGRDPISPRPPFEQEVPPLPMEEEIVLFDEVIGKWNQAHACRKDREDCVAIIGPKAQLVRYVWGRAVAYAREQA